MRVYENIVSFESYRLRFDLTLCAGSSSDLYSAQTRKQLSLPNIRTDSAKEDRDDHEGSEFSLSSA